LRGFKWYLNHGAIGCAVSLNMGDSTFVNDLFTNQLFHGQVRIGIRSHYFSVTVYLGQDITENFLDGWSYQKAQKVSARICFKLSDLWIYRHEKWSGQYQWSAHHSKEYSLFAHCITWAESTYCMSYEHFRVPQDHAINFHNLQLRRCVGGRERCFSPMTHMPWKDYTEFDSVESGSDY
jgi:hypothetical protein